MFVFIRTSEILDGFPMFDVRISPNVITEALLAFQWEARLGWESQMG
jgi:hypothetical protein